jgi:hypothetical protein
MIAAFNAMRVGERSVLVVVSETGTVLRFPALTPLTSVLVTVLAGSEIRI